MPDFSIRAHGPTAVVFSGAVATAPLDCRDTQLANAAPPGTDSALERRVRDALQRACCLLLAHQARLRVLCPVPPARMAAADTAAPPLPAWAAGALDMAVDESHYEFFNRVLALLTRLDGEWLSRYSDILGNYVDFFDKLTSAMALLKDAVTGHDDKGNLRVNFDNVIGKLNELLDDVENGAGLGGGFATRAEAEAFLKELGVNGLVVKADSQGGFELAVDPQMITDLIAVFPSGSSDMNPARYNAIITAKDSQMERFNHVNRVLPDKYQRQLQMWDTLVKALSGTIDSVTQADRLFAQNLT